MPPFEVARKLQAACAITRSFLGPHNALKCVIDDSSDSRSCLVGTAQAFLLAADGDPTATTLLLEALECQAPSSSGSPAPGSSPGSGSTWLAVFCGLLLDRMLELVEGQGVPYDCVRAGVLDAVAECCEVVRSCALELPAVVAQWDERALVSYYEAVSSLMHDGSAACPALSQPPPAAAEAESLAPRLELRERPPPPPPQMPAGSGTADNAVAETAIAVAKAKTGVELEVEAGPTSPCRWDSVPTSGGSQATGSLRVPLATAASHGVQTSPPEQPCSSSAVVRGAVSCDDDEFGWFDEKVDRSQQEQRQAGPPNHRHQHHRQQAQVRQQHHHPRATLRRPAEGSGDIDDDEFGWFESYDTDSCGDAAAARELQPASQRNAPRPLRGPGNPPQPSPAAPPVAGDARWVQGSLTAVSSLSSGSSSSSGSGDSGYGSGFDLLPRLLPGAVDGGRDLTVDAVHDTLRRDGGVAGSGEEEAVLVGLEEEAAWFFDEGELRAERAARAQRRALGAGLGAMVPTEAAVLRQRGGGGGGGGGGDGGEGRDVRRRGDQGRRTGAEATIAPPLLPTQPLSLPLPAPRLGQQPEDHQSTRSDDCDEGGVATPPGIVNATDRTAVAAERDGIGGGCGAGASRGPDPLARLVCGAAAGLAHGRWHEMHLAAAAVLLLLGPLVRHPELAAAQPATGAAEGLEAVSATVRRAAVALQYDRCVLTAELLGRAAEGAAAAMRGVLVPLAALSADQAALAAAFFCGPRERQPPPAPSSASASASADGTDAATDAATITAVFFHGALHPDHAAYGPVIVTDAASLAAASAGAREEAFAARLLAALRPHGVHLLLASGHLPDRVAAALHQLSGGGVLALGGVGLRAVQAAASCCCVAPAASLAFLSGRHVAVRVQAQLVGGGLGVRDYRPGATHAEAGVMLRLLATPGFDLGREAASSVAGAAAGAHQQHQQQPQRRPPGWVTVVLAHPLTSQLEVQAVAFRTCFNRLVAALRGGQVLPGAGAWELAAAEHLARRADQLELQAAEVPTADVGLAGGADAFDVCDEQAAMPCPFAEAAAHAAEEALSLYLSLSYRAVSEALRDVVGVLLQNGGCGYGEALQAGAACARALREGDSEALRRLAGGHRGERAADWYTGGAGAGGALPAPAGSVEQTPKGGYGRRGSSELWRERKPWGCRGGAETAELQRDDVDERRQLAAALSALVELRDMAAAAAAAAARARGGGVLEAAPPPALVLDEPGARESALRGGCRLALLASCVDAVITNR